MSVIIDGASGITTPAISDSGNLTFTGTGNRITGDFSNATVANRVMFQTNTTNGASQVEVIPNGSSTTSNLIVSNSSTDPANASLGTLFVGSTEVRVQSLVRGTGTYLPLTFYTGGSERMRIDTSGNVGIGTSSPSSYGKFAVQNGDIAAVSGDGSVQSVHRASNTGQVQLSSYNAAGTSYLTFGTGNGVERMRIDSAGRVGIGNSSPSAALTIGDGSASSTILLKSTGGGAISGQKVTTNEWFVGGVEQGLGSGNGLLFYTYSGVSRPIRFYVEAVEQAQIDSAGLFKFNSGYGSVATAYGCRAWVNFNGTGTVAIRASGNVTSITDNGTGDYTVNFTNAMPDTNFSAPATCKISGSNSIAMLHPDFTDMGTSFVRYKTALNTGSASDSIQVHIAVFR